MNHPLSPALRVSGRSRRKPAGSWASNLPNQNDTYVVAGGSLTAMKYDLFGGGDSLSLRADGSFAVSDGLQTVGSGTYALAPVPEPATLGMAVAAIAAGCWWRFRRRRSN